VEKTITMALASTSEKLNAAQKAYEFADKLNYYFQFISESRRDTYNINSLLLEYLGTEKYKQFCEIFRSENREEGAKYLKDHFFKVEFIENPVQDEHIVFDWQVKCIWKGPPNLNKAIMKLL
jgi:hypothetical protein